MKKWLLLVVSLLFVFSAALALAQTTQPEPPKEFQLSVTGADIDVIGRALGSQPYAVVAPLMAKLQMQIVQQQKADEAKAAKK